MIREEFEEFQEKWLKNVTQEQLMKETESKPPYEEPVLVINEDGLYAIAKYKKDVKGTWCDEWCIFNTPYDSEGWHDDECGRIIAWIRLPWVSIEEDWKFEIDEH